MSEYCSQLFKLIFSALLSFFLNRLAIAASTKVETERLLGKEKKQGEIVR